MRRKSTGPSLFHRIETPQRSGSHRWGFTDPFSRGDPQDGDPNAAIRDQDATQWNK